MRIIVAGSAGFVGGHLYKAMADGSDDIIGIDLKDGNDILTADLPDADRVFHLAAQTDAQSNDAISDARTNVLGTVRLLEKYGNRLVYASSCAVNYPVTP